MWRKIMRYCVGVLLLLFCCSLLGVYGFDDDSGGDWARLPYVTDNSSIIEQILPYDCSCKAIQLSYYGVTSILVDEKRLIDWVKPRPGYGADAKMIQEGIDHLNKDYGTDIHISWFWTDEIGGLPGTYELYKSRNYSVFQNLPGHFQVIRGINTKNKSLTIYNSLNNTTSTSGMYDTEPGVYEWSFERDYNLINQQNWAAWAVLKQGAFPPVNITTVNRTGFNGETIELIANLTDRDHNGEDNEIVTFRIGNFSINGTTNDGIAKVSYIISEDPGLYNITATYFNNQSITCNGFLKVYPMGSSMDNFDIEEKNGNSSLISRSGFPLIMLLVLSICGFYLVKSR
ncbi:MAG: hypothetical protein LBR15_05200 [Methanobrevibacter sp.]|jgi:hypothetical protein|nr:hypothetical protein [Candidatus Methanovirga australis]